MKRALLALVLAGCATAPPPRASERSRDDIDQLQALTVRQEALARDAVPSVDRRGLRCPDVCELSTNICGIADHICAIRDRHRREAEFEKACFDARARCARNTGPDSPCRCPRPASP